MLSQRHLIPSSTSKISSLPPTWPTIYCVSTPATACTTSTSRGRMIDVVGSSTQSSGAGCVRWRTTTVDGCRGTRTSMPGGDVHQPVHVTAGIALAISSSSGHVLQHSDASTLSHSLLILHFINKITRLSLCRAILPDYLRCDNQLHVPVHQLIFVAILFKHLGLLYMQTFSFYFNYQPPELKLVLFSTCVCSNQKAILETLFSCRPQRTWLHFDTFVCALHRVIAKSRYHDR